MRVKIKNQHASQQLKKYSITLHKKLKMKITPCYSLLKNVNHEKMRIYFRREGRKIRRRVQIAEIIRKYN